MKANRRLRDLKRRPRSGRRNYVIAEGERFNVTTQVRKGGTVRSERREVAHA